MNLKKTSGEESNIVIFTGVNLIIIGGYRKVGVLVWALFDIHVAMRTGSLDCSHLVTLAMSKTW